MFIATVARLLCRVPAGRGEQRTVSTRLEVAPSREITEPQLLSLEATADLFWLKGPNVSV